MWVLPEAQIYNKTGLDKSLLSKYLSVLEKTGIIEKNQPPTLNFKRKLKAIGARYSIKDNFFDFWFRFVYTNLTELERGNSGSVVNTIQSEFPMYLGNKFERIVMELILHFDIFKYSRIGKWWYKDVEIDIVAINENTNEILFCECKWQNRKTNVNILTELMDKAKHVNWNNDLRKEYYMAASKSGFTEEAKIFAKQNNFILVSSKDIEARI